MEEHCRHKPYRPYLREIVHGYSSSSTAREGGKRTARASHHIVVIMVSRFWNISRSFSRK